MAAASRATVKVSMICLNSDELYHLQVCQLRRVIKHAAVSILSPLTRSNHSSLIGPLHLTRSSPRYSLLSCKQSATTANHHHQWVAAHLTMKILQEISTEGFCVLQPWATLRAGFHGDNPYISSSLTLFSFLTEQKSP